MFSISKLTSGKAKKFFSLLFLIGILKLISFITPLMVNSVSSSVESFGVFEYSFNVGQILIPLLSMGLSGGYAFYVLKNKEIKMKATFHFHFFFITTLALLIAVIYPNILNSNYYGAILIALTFSNQVFIAGIKRIENRNYSSVFIESGLYLVLLVLVLSFLTLHLTFNFHVWFLVLLIYNVVLTLFYHFKHIKFGKIKKEYFIKTYSFGAKVMLAGLLVFLLCNSTRVFTKFFLNETAVGLYSIIFRIGAASVLIYKTVIVLIYKELYVSDYKYLDRTFAKMIITALFVCIILFFGFPYYSMYIIKHQTLFQIIDYKIIFIIFLQAVLWGNFSLLEPIFQRENKVVQQIGIIAVAVSSMFFLMWVLHEYFILELIHICLINNLMISSAILFTMLYLKSEKVFLRRTLSLSILLLLITVINVVF